MLKFVLGLVFLSLSLEGVDAISLGQCVCAGYGENCGLVVTILPDSLEIYRPTGISTVSLIYVMELGDDMCDFRVEKGSCLCAHKDTSLYSLDSNEPFPVTTGSCYVANGTGYLEFIIDPAVFEVVEDQPDPSVMRKILRRDWVIDVSGEGCPESACSEEPVPNSPSCTAVFPGGASITKGQLNDRCYYGVDQRCRYPEARTFCEDAGLNLVWVETAEEGQAVAEMTGFDEYWVGLERPLFSCDNWVWVSADLSVDADADVEGRFRNPYYLRFFSCFINRAVVKRNEAGEYPLKRTIRWRQKKFVCEETVTCSDEY